MNIEYPYTYSGNLETYYETGYEGMSAVILSDDRGNHEAPKWDNPKEMMTYKSLEWAHFFDKHATQYLQVFDPDGKEIYNGPITLDRKKLSDLDFRLSFVPKEVPVADWITWITKEYKATVWSDKPALIHDEKYQAESKAIRDKHKNGN